jgi:hypothetical protein
MFDSLSDRMREDDLQTTKTSERLLLWAAVIVVSVVVFGGLYFAVRMIQ